MHPDPISGALASPAGLANLQVGLRPLVEDTPPKPSGEWGAVQAKSGAE
jgi:hypothetical protein